MGEIVDGTGPRFHSNDGFTVPSRSVPSLHEKPWKKTTPKYNPPSVKLMCRVSLVASNMPPLHGLRCSGATSLLSKTIRKTRVVTRLSTEFCASGFAAQKISKTFHKGPQLSFQKTKQDFSTLWQAFCPGDVKKRPLHPQRATNTGQFSRGI